MARCDQGYLCDVCGEQVSSIRESDLYLRYVIGRIATRELMSSPERHLRCNVVTAQFIDSPDFDPIIAEGPFSRRELDEESVQPQTELITRCWYRLQELAQQAQTLPLSEYPLQEFRRQQNM